MGHGRGGANLIPLRLRVCNSSKPISCKMKCAVSWPECLLLDLNEQASSVTAWTAGAQEHKGNSDQHCPNN